MGRGLNVLWRRSAREAVRLCVLAVALSGCRDAVPALRVARRIPLPQAGVRHLAVLPTGQIFLGAAGRAVVADSLGRVVRAVQAPGGAPELVVQRGARLVVRQGPRELALLDLDSGAVVGRRRAPRDAPAAADRRGRWIYTTHGWGSVLGLDSGLVARWGWPDVGGRATALAVGTLGDRLYLGVDEGEDRPPSVHILEAWSGAHLGAWAAGRPPAGLVAGPDPTVLFMWDREDVLALRHGPGGLYPLWRTSRGRLGMDTVTALRPSPDGRRLAVLGRRGERGRLAVLSAATGRDTARWNGSPPDVAWDGRGRLLVAEGSELLWLR